jgi:hypothetical protein
MNCAGWELAEAARVPEAQPPLEQPDAGVRWVEPNEAGDS